MKSFTAHSLTMERLRLETLQKLQNANRSDCLAGHSSNIELVVRANYRTKKYQTTSYFDQPPSYEYPPTYEEAKIIQKYYKFTLRGQ